MTLFDTRRIVSIIGTAGLVFTGQVETVTSSVRPVTMSRLGISFAP